jgi:hypothetical protein
MVSRPWVLRYIHIACLVEILLPLRALMLLLLLSRYSFSD